MLAAGLPYTPGGRIGQVVYGERNVAVRIAVLDNDRNILQLMHEVFADSGWESLPFHEGTDAVERLAREQPDAIIVDSRLDGHLGGLQVLRQLKDQSRTRGIPAALWTGGGDALKDHEGWLSEHNVPVIPKPFELDEVYATLRAMLNRTPTRTGVGSLDEVEPMSSGRLDAT